MKYPRAAYSPIGLLLAGIYGGLVITFQGNLGALILIGLVFGLSFGVDTIICGDKKPDRTPIKSRAELTQAAYQELN